MSKLVRNKSSFIRNDQWNLLFEEDLMIVNAGADEIYAIEDVSKSQGAEIIKLWQSDAMDPASLSDDAKAIIEQLKTAGVILNEIQKKPKYKIGIKFIGSDNDTLLELFSDKKLFSFELSKEHYDLLVYIRTNGQLRDIVSNYSRNDMTPHILLDLAFHHSVSLGPLVFMGDSACLGCLVGRLTQYWGDAKPPAKPLIQKNLGLIISLLNIELEKILFAYNRELVNTTVAYNFNEHKVMKNKIYKVPICPVCANQVDMPGSFKLPWI